MGAKGALYVPFVVLLTISVGVREAQSFTMEQIDNLTGGVLSEQTKLSLSNQGLTGPISSDLGTLTNLTYVDLSSNMLSGPIPPELGNLADLTYLDLSYNSLSSTIPPELGNLANLAYLGLSNNDLSGPIPPEIGNLSQLANLRLGYNKLSGRLPPELSNLPFLSTIDFGSNNLSGPFALDLTTMPLWIVYLYDNSLSGLIPPEIGNMSFLDYLNLSGNNLSGPIPSELGSLDRLRSEDATDNIIDLSNNSLSGPIPPELSNLTYLRNLFLDTNQLSGNIPPELGNLRLLEILNLGNNQLSGTVPPEFGSLTNLTELDLSNNSLSGPVPPELSNLPLTTLYLDATKDLGTVPPGFGASSSLVVLFLPGPLPAYLHTFKSLGFLRFGFAQTKTSQLDLSAAPPGCQYIKWTGGKVTDIKFWDACTSGAGCAVDLTGTGSKLSRATKREVCLGKISVFLEGDAPKIDGTSHGSFWGPVVGPPFYLSNSYGNYFLNNTSFLDQIDLGPRSVTYTGVGVSRVRPGNLCANPEARCVVAITYGVWGLLVLLASLALHVLTILQKQGSPFNGKSSKILKWLLYAWGVFGGVLSWVDLYTDVRVLAEVWRAWPMWPILASVVASYAVAGWFAAAGWVRARGPWAAAHKLRLWWIWPPPEDDRLAPLPFRNLSPTSFMVTFILWPLGILGVLVQDAIAVAGRVGVYPSIESRVFSLELSPSVPLDAGAFVEVPSAGRFPDHVVYPGKLACNADLH